MSSNTSTHQSSLLHSPIFRRWLDMLALAVCVLVFGWIFRTPLLDAALWWNRNSSSWVSFPGYVSTALIMAILTISLIRLGALGMRFNAVRMLNYPPSWFSVIIVFFLFVVIVACGEGLGNSDQIIADLPHLAVIVSVCSLGSLLGFAYHWFDVSQSSARQLEAVEPNRNFQLNNKDDLLAWVLEESPIQHPNQDMFCHSSHAMRIAGLLSNSAPSNIGIVGPYGSGKSSIIGLVKYFLTNSDPGCISDLNQQYSGKFIFCQIDGWGRTSDTIAPKILTMAIDEVKRHVDCTSVITLPEHYRNAITGTNVIGGAVLSVLLQSSRNPVSQLHRLDNILAASKLRLIIVLEDLDRNSVSQIVKDEMSGLLDRLRTLSNISFILAIGGDRQFSDVLIRICDHVEAIS